MPEMSGRELVAEARLVRPGVRALFMSGYTDEVIAQRGVLEDGYHLIKKPFDAPQLNARVADLLEERAPDEH
jgi:response regulator RpfG family c-di-GMP phosphodiesterase